MSVARYGGARYFVPLFDDSSSVSLVQFLDKKSEAQNAVQYMVLELESATASRVKRARSDNGAE